MTTFKASQTATPSSGRCSTSTSPAKPRLAGWMSTRMPKPPTHVTTSRAAPTTQRRKASVTSQSQTPCTKSLISQLIRRSCTCAIEHGGSSTRFQASPHSLPNSSIPWLPDHASPPSSPAPTNTMRSPTIGPCANCQKTSPTTSTTCDQNKTTAHTTTEHLEQLTFNPQVDYSFPPQLRSFRFTFLHLGSDQSSNDHPYFSPGTDQLGTTVAWKDLGLHTCTSSFHLECKDWQDGSPVVQGHFLVSFLGRSPFRAAASAVKRLLPPCRFR